MKLGYMRLIYKRDKVRTARDLWMKQYQHYSDDKTVGLRGERSIGSIRAALSALDPDTCSASDVEAAIGADGWTSHKCDACEGDFDVLVQIGDEPDYEARWLDLCPACLMKAASMGTGK